MSSSCIPTGLRLDLDMVKAAASPGAHSSPLRPVHSSPSSTLSEASNVSSSATSVSLKRARAPRKRPNQAYNEAAALLASIHPSVFPVKKSPKTAPRPPLRQLSALAAAFDPSSDLLPPLPVLTDSAFLLRDMPVPSPHPPSPSGAKNCSSPAPVSSVFRDFRDPVPSPATPDTADELGEIDFDDDCFDAESILDVDEAAGDAAEGIDSIMGSLTVESNTCTTSDDSILSSSGIHPYLRNLMVVGLAGRFELGLGFRHGARPNLNRALKRRDDDGTWWMWPAVPVKDLTVAPPPPPPPTTTTTTTTTAEASNTAMPQAAEAPEKKKRKKKKVVKVEKVMAKSKEELPNAKCKEEAVEAVNGDGDSDSTPTKAPKAGLGLKLDANEVLKEWSDKGSMFVEGSATDSTTSAAEMRAKLADIDLFPENGAGGIREASVLRYKEKRRTRLFSKKIRYQVRKVNADCRPRMKGRFVRSPSLLQQVLEEES